MAIDHLDLLEAMRELRRAINSSLIVLGETADSAFDCSTTASLVKAYEFCIEATESNKENSFFLLASLRGICEDYISLKFIHEKEKASENRICFLRASEETYASSIAQWHFFAANRPSQRLYYGVTFDDALKDIRKELKLLLKDHLNKSNASMPKVYYMAEKVGLIPLYRYVYHATSQFVHFNPRLLLRLGWFGPPKFEFSTKSFGGYYNDFSMFYGVYLLVEMFEWLSSINSAAIIEKSPVALLSLKNCLQDTARWPELVTFEEMNIGSLSRTLFYKSPDGIEKT